MWKKRIRSFQSAPILAGRTARATANQFDDESLRRAVAASENLARVQAPDPDLLPMPTSEEANAAGKSGRNRRHTVSLRRLRRLLHADRAEVVTENCIDRR
jgi:predicted Zn-dependent protease